MIDSIAPQLTDQDFLTVIWDCPKTAVNYNTTATILEIKNAHPMGHWGHGSRTFWQNSLPGDYLINGDDDDIFVEDAMFTIREHCTEDKLYVFQMLQGEQRIPRHHAIEYTNIGTPCGVYKPGGLPDWKFKYGGDYEFYKTLSETKEVEFIDKVIYKVKP